MPHEPAGRPTHPQSADPAATSLAIEPRRLRGGAVKRALDVVIAAGLLVGLSPLLAVLAVLVRLDSRGPALYRGQRLGLGRQPITVYKFRSMAVDAPDDAHRRYVLSLLRSRDRDRPGPAEATGGTRFKLTDDPRITRAGRWMRRSTLDELPQLLNVFRGEMSLVGPRPEVPYALEAYEPWHHERFAVKPGLTGLWQVSGRGELSPRDMLALDVEYARRQSLRLDVEILVRTVPALLSARGAS